MVQRRCPKLFRFQHGTAKGATKWMVELPNIVYRLVGIGVYARMVRGGHLLFSLHPGCGFPRC